MGSTCTNNQKDPLSPTIAVPKRIKSLKPWTVFFFAFSRNVVILKLQIYAKVSSFSQLDIS